MKRHIFILLLMGLMPIHLFARTITREEAANFALRFLSDGESEPELAPMLLNTDEDDLFAQEGHEYMYLVQTINDGWVVMPTDDRFPPVLAKGDSIFYPFYDSIPPAMRGLLDGYILEMKYILDSTNYTTSDPKWNWFEDEQDEELNNYYGNALTWIEEPYLLKDLSWGQSFSNDRKLPVCYNKFCPNGVLRPNKKCYAGCTAVAMAQVMKYWQWPHSVYIPTEISPEGITSVEKILRIYYWRNMPNKLDSINIGPQIDAVAKLIRDCGFGANMIYTTDWSFATLEDARNSLIHDFQYNEGIERKLRQNYRKNTWAQLLRDEINAGRPVIYGATGLLPWDAHAFIVDGYQCKTENGASFDADLFHINWGWNGEKNGWMYLGSLKDISIKDGDTTTTWYKYNHRALIGIHPKAICEAKHLPIDSLIMDTCRVETGARITLLNKIGSNAKTAFFSGSEIRIRPGFYAQKGSNVTMQIRYFPCEQMLPPSVRAMPRIPKEDIKEDTIVEKEHFSWTVSPNPVTSHLIINTVKNILSVELYSIDGRQYKWKGQKQIDVSTLPNGIYLLRAHCTNNEILQTKIIKQ